MQPAQQQVAPVIEGADPDNLEDADHHGPREDGQGIGSSRQVQQEKITRAPPRCASLSWGAEFLDPFFYTGVG